MKWAGRAFFAVVTILFLVSLLPTLGVVDQSSCEWGGNKSAQGFALSPAALQGMAVTMRSNDVDVGRDLRAGVVAGLEARGVNGIVDNPVTYPRLTITVEELAARWLPFRSTVAMKVRAQLARDKRGPHDIDATIKVEGGCFGLVKKEGWLKRPVDDAAAQVVSAIVER